MEKQLFKDILSYNRIIIHRHTRPDLDALGSQIGLAETLKAAYPEKEIYMVGDPSIKYAFIGQMDEIDDSLYKDALVIIVDVAVDYMISDERYKIADKVWVIDHHKNQCNVSENWLCEPKRSAAAEYIPALLLRNGFDIPAHAATAFLGGMITDSGRFMYGEDMAETLTIAASLIRCGGSPKYIYDRIYTESLADRDMKNYFAQRVKMRDGVAWLENPQEVFEKYPREFNDISRGMLSLMSGVDEIRIWCNFTYDKESDSIKCEFRSRTVEIVGIAKELGGGGHANACGCTLYSFDEVEGVIDRFVKLLKETDANV